MSVNDALPGCAYEYQYVGPEPDSGRVSQQLTIAERLLAYARLCREIAGESWNEHTAQQLEQLAAECDRTASHARNSAPPASGLH